MTEHFPGYPRDERILKGGVHISSEAFIGQDLNVLHETLQDKPIALNGDLKELGYDLLFFTKEQMSTNEILLEWEWQPRPARFSALRSVAKAINEIPMLSSDARIVHQIVDQLFRDGVLK